MPSRGTAISAYIPAFAKGAKVYGANIADDAITSAHIADGTIVAADVAAGSITSAKLGTGAVTSIKLGAGSVISAKIGAGAVLAANLGAGSVTSAKLGTDAVTAVKILAGAVTSAKLGSKAVTNGKMNAAFLSGTIVSGRITVEVAHGLSAVPKFVIVNALPTLAEATLSAGTVGNHVYLAAASAATSANFYVIGTQAANAAMKYVAYVQI